MAKNKGFFMFKVLEFGELIIKETSNDHVDIERWTQLKIIIGLPRK